MKKILFVIHSLVGGGAEKVLVNLVNHLDRKKYDISVIAIFGGGINEKYLAKDIHFRTVFSKPFPGNSQLLKIFTPQQLHRLCIREKYDIEISYLEGVAARVVSGCDDKNTKLISWIHVEQHNMKNLAHSFRSHKEASRCYERFDQIVCVSQYVKNDFINILDFKGNCIVLFNTVESDVILKQAKAPVDLHESDGKIRLIAVGTLKASKGYDILLRIICKLKKKYNVHLYILGVGPLKEKLEKYVLDLQIDKDVTFLGYDTNPYKYVRNCDLFVCASQAEGFSTAATEALIVGTPVCTVDVSGMKEMLGENNEFGVVTENSENGLYEGIEMLLDRPDMLKAYKVAAVTRGKAFSTKETVLAVEKLFDEIAEK